MTFNEFLELVDETFMSHKASGSNQWRYGQTLMNVLWQTHRDKYEGIVGTEYDCFYTNTKIDKTLQKLKEEWE